MIETIKDMKHPKSNSYENLGLERTANQILHHMEDKDSEDSLESTRIRVLSNARAIYGSTRLLDVITFGPTSSRRIGAAIVEHNPTGRSFIHCVSAKESSRLAATEHLLVITEDILYRLIDTEGITSSGWLPTTPASQHAVTYGACGNSVAGSVMGSRKSSVAPQEPMAISYINDYHSPLQHVQQTRAVANNSDQSSFRFPTPPVPQQPQQQPQLVAVQRASSDITAPQPVSANQFPGKARVAWKLGSED